MALLRVTVFPEGALELADAAVPVCVAEPARVAWYVGPAEQQDELVGDALAPAEQQRDATPSGRWKAGVSALPPVADSLQAVEQGQARQALVPPEGQMLPLTRETTTRGHERVSY